MNRPALAALAVLAAGCGVDRLPAGDTRVHIMFDMPGVQGGAVRDDRGLFDLQDVGAYVAVTVRAEDFEVPIVADWPDTPNPADEAEIEMLVPAGTGRTLEALVLVLSDDDLSAYTGQTSVDLIGGTDMDIDLHVDPSQTAPVHETLSLDGGPDPGQVIVVHPVDVEHDVLYPAAEFSIVEGSLDVHSGSLPRGRPVRWTLLTLSGEWFDLDGETQVP